MKDLVIGTEHSVECKVTASQTAAEMGSGSLAVLATPAVIALMEKAACELLAPCLAEGTTTVGTQMAVEHLSATPVGAPVKVTAVLTGVEDRKYTFTVTAYDVKGLIARGNHERFLVRSERVLEKTYQKLKESDSHA